MPDTLDCTTLEQIDEICTRFEDELLAGRAPDIQQFLGSLQGAAARKLLSELNKVAQHFQSGCADTPDCIDRTVGYVVSPSALEPRTALPSLPGYTIVERIGHGGMGVVYKARNNGRGGWEAVKIIGNAEWAEPEEKARFKREAKVVAGLNHRNIVRVHGSDDFDGLLYLAMELATGGTLADCIKENPPTPREAASLLSKVAGALEHAHRHGILHRDLKPGNVLLDEEGEPLVADFGLARRLDAHDTLSQSNQILGTVGYMAPEQARADRHLTYAADVFSMGVILYELLTGQRPFTGGTFSEVLSRTLECAPLHPQRLKSEIDDDLAVICMKCLEKKPDDRYASAGELKLDLERYLSGSPIQARLPGIWGQATRLMLHQRFGNINRWGWVTVGFGVLSLGIHLVAAGLIAAEQPRVAFLPLSIIFLVTATSLCRWAVRGQRTDVGDRHTLTLIAGMAIATTILPYIYRPPEGAEGVLLTEYRLSTYPLYALINGLSYFIFGSIFWGGYYIYGISFFVLAILMKLFSAISPIAYAVYLGTTQILLGIYLIRLRKQYEADRCAPPAFSDYAPHNRASQDS